MLIMVYSITITITITVITITIIAAITEAIIEVIKSNSHSYYKVWALGLIDCQS